MEDQAETEDVQESDPSDSEDYATPPLTPECAEITEAAGPVARQQDARDQQMVQTTGNLVVNLPEDTDGTVNVAGQMSTVHNELHQHQHQHIDKVVRQHTKHVTYVVNEETIGYDQLKDQTAFDLLSQSDTFLKTQNYESTVQLLRTHGLLLIHGPPVCGKSSLGRALLRQFCDEGYTPLILHRYNDWRYHCGGERKQIVLLDNIFGRLTLDPRELQKWGECFTSMLGLARSAKCLVVITLHSHIFQEIQSTGLYREFFKQIPEMDLNMTAEFSLEEKKEMIQIYARKFQKDVPEKVTDEILAKDKSGSLFPWCVQNYIEDAHCPDLTVFSSPHQAYMPFLNTALADKDHGKCMAATLLTGIGYQLFDTSDLEELECRLSKFGFSSKECENVHTVRKYYSGNMFSQNNFCFSSRALYDACGIALAQKTEHLSILLQVSDVQFLIERITAQHSCSTNTIAVKKSTQAYKFLVKRFFQEFKCHNFQEICQHPIMQETVFLAHLKEECFQNKKLFKAILSARDSQHREVLLYWSMFCTQPQLAKWCVEQMQEQKIDKCMLISALQRSLFVSALSGDSTSSEKIQTFCWALQKYSTAKQNSTTMMRLALPKKEQCYHRDLKKRRETLCNRSQSHTICYLNDPSFPIPYTMLVGSTDTVRLSLPGNETYVVLRLLADRQVDEEDDEGNTLLHVAAGAGDLDAIQIALKSGGSVLARNSADLKPSDLCSIRKKRMWFKISSPISSDLLHAACMDGDRFTASVRLCYDSCVRDRGYKGRSPLHTAASAGHIDTALLLIQLGASIDSKNNKGCTPLYLASAAGHRQMATLLIEHGANIHAKNKSGSTPLHVACFNSHYEVAKVLVEKGAEINPKNEKGMTPFYLACCSNCEDIVELLLKNGAEVNGKSKEGATALHVSSELSDSNLVKCLLEGGADVDVKGKHKLTPLHFACHFGHEHHALRLVEAGADINARDNKGYTPLHNACENGYVNIAVMLIEKEASINIKSVRGLTPLHLASKKGHRQIVQLLLQHRAKFNTSGRLFSVIKPVNIARRRGHEDIVDIFKGMSEKK